MLAMDCEKRALFGHHDFGLTIDEQGLICFFRFARSTPIERQMSVSSHGASLAIPFFCFVFTMRYATAYVYVHIYKCNADAIPMLVSRTEFA